MHSEAGTAIATVPAKVADVGRLPQVPWRDPHTVSREQLADYIAVIEKACELQPHSADLRTCLGMAHAMNYDVYNSMDALAHAVELDANSFWAQIKFAELYYRLRALERAERETVRALSLAGDAFELSLARRQLQTIRELKRQGTQKPEWTRSLRAPAALLVLMCLVICLGAFWK